MNVSKLTAVERISWARLCLGLGGLLLLTAPFLPYTTVSIGTWNLALRGIFLTGLGLIICAVVLILQAALGRGSLLWSWIALFIAGLSLKHDVQICLRDIGLALGKIQLAFSGVNQVLIGIGLPPLHIVDAQQINHRCVETGVYWAAFGIAVALSGTIVWLTARGREAIWPVPARCACGRSLSRKYRFCPHCGELVKTAKNCCRECGGDCAEDWKYCAKCGAARS